jgi:hypothetical protein
MAGEPSLALVLDVGARFQRALFVAHVSNVRIRRARW